MRLVNQFGAPLQISAGFASWQRYCTASSSVQQPNFALLNRGRHLCSAGRPSRWALAHILVYYYFKLMQNFYHVIITQQENCRHHKYYPWFCPLERHSIYAALASLLPRQLSANMASSTKPAKGNVPNILLRFGRVIFQIGQTDRHCNTLHPYRGQPGELKHCPTKHVYISDAMIARHIIVMTVEHLCATHESLNINLTVFKEGNVALH